MESMVVPIQNKHCFCIATRCKNSNCDFDLFKYQDTLDGVVAKTDKTMKMSTCDEIKYHARDMSH
jgi:hypothetical protein